MITERRTVGLPRITDAWALPTGPTIAAMMLVELSVPDVPSPSDPLSAGVEH